ncbi:MAG: L,D-transpeptidase family protein [Muribaculaceae bacterium]|nr:L,D-transpeptidase family protein [Muribaculaceae bacterium]
MKFFNLAITALTLIATIACGNSENKETKAEINDTTVVASDKQSTTDAKQEFINTFKGKQFVIVSKQDMTLYLYDETGKILKKYPCACGKALGDKRKVGDMRTPEGIFKVAAIQDASTWTHDFKDGKGVIKGCYGSNFVRLTTPGHNGIGIHGTHDPKSIGTRATEGCIRLPNEAITEFAKLAYRGMPVIILTSDKDAAVNAKEGERVTGDVAFDKGDAKPKQEVKATKQETAKPKQEVKKQKKESKAKTPTGKTKSYTIKNGENLSVIAHRNHTTASELMKINGITDVHSLRPGQKIRIPIK